MATLYKRGVMEAGSSDKQFYETKVVKVGFVIVILLLPVVFAAATWIIGKFAYDNDLFYIHPNLPKIFAFIIFPFTLIYLWLRSLKPRFAKLFATFTTIVVLATLFIITVIDTAKYESVINISEEFATPDGWVKLPSEMSKYGYFGGTWTKTDEGAPLTAEDLQQIASDNNMKTDGEIEGTCYPSSPSLGCTLSGDINGKKVRLTYFDSAFPNDPSRIMVRINEPTPKSYKRLTRGDVYLN